MDDDIIEDAATTALDRPANSRPTAQGAASSKTNGATNGGSRKVQQPKPQALDVKSASAILVSPRQKGNPVLEHVRSVGWEYSDIPADFVLGATTCALFLSLKYHRLHPEYIYQRIKNLGGRYNLRIVLVFVDIENHEEPLKELSKTSLINNVTVILSWRAEEAGRYLELYKNYEHAAPTSIKGIQSTTYSDQLVDFVTVPRGINKTDAVSLVSNFGSIRTAINARPEEIALIGGWGEKKVQRWCENVRAPFRLERAARRGLIGGLPPALSRDVSRADSSPALSRHVTHAESDQNAQVAARLGIGEPLPLPAAPAPATDATADADKRSETRIADDFPTWEPGADEEEALAAMESGNTSMTSRKPQRPQPLLHPPQTTSPAKRKQIEDDLSEGVAAALSKLRKT